MPYYTILLVPPRSEDIKEFKPGARDSIFIIEDWPFRTEDRLKTAIEFREAYPYCLITIIICRPDRITLPTDISNIETAAEDASAAYKAENFYTLVFDAGGLAASLSGLFYWKGREYIDTLKQYLKRRLKALPDLTERLKSQFELLRPEMNDGFLSPVELDGFTRYRESFNGQAPAKFFIDQSTEVFFRPDSQFVSQVGYILADCTNDLDIWDSGRITDALIKRLKARYNHDMGAALDNACFTGQNELEYVEFMNKSELDVSFKQECGRFFTDSAWEILENSIQSLITSLRRVCCE
jgi:hypothetical protein